MKRSMALHGVLALTMMVFGASNAAAQVFGTFTWQMQPYCNKVTLTLTSVTGNFRLDGSEDQCGATKKASASGVGVFNPDGTVGLNFTIVPSSGPSVHVSASVSPANGQGTWGDDFGNTGAFAFFGNTPSLPARPSGLAKFRVTGLTTSTLSSASLTTMSWSASPDTDAGGGVYNSAAGTYAVPRAGDYLVTTTVRFGAFAAGTGHRCIYVTVGTARRSVACDAPSTTASFQIQPLSTVLSLNAGDLVSIQAFQSSGAAVPMGSSGESDFTVTRLR